MIKALHHIGIASKNIDKDIGFFLIRLYAQRGKTDGRVVGNSGSIFKSGRTT